MTAREGTAGPFCSRRNLRDSSTDVRAAAPGGLGSQRRQAGFSGRGAPAPRRSSAPLWTAAPVLGCGRAWSGPGAQNQASGGCLGSHRLSAARLLGCVPGL